MKKVLILPGWMTSIKFYSSDIYISIGKLDEKSLSSEYVIGLSLGALIVLKNAQNIDGKIILINPLFPKRSISQWFVQWLKYITNEGLFLKKQKFTINPFKYISETINHVKLLNIDFSKTLDNVSKDKIIVIRGKKDNFFCDQLAVNFLKSKGIKVIEVESGHNWSNEIEKKLNSF